MKAQNIFYGPGRTVQITKHVCPTPSLYFSTLQKHYATRILWTHEQVYL